ncbi:virulence factor TspB C-terminal domain-related protein, partial [Alcanivoracaceae bacterium MT1]
PGDLFCYESCRFTYDGPTSSSVPWIYANGTKTYWVNGISSGQTCQAEEIPDAWVDNGMAIPDRWSAEDVPFGQFLDSEGCYIGINQDRFCQTETGGCPNSVTAPDGKRYCLMSDDDDEDPGDPSDPGDPGDPDEPDDPDEPEEPEVYCDENGGWNGSSYCNAGDDGHWGPGCGWDCGGDDGGGGNDGDDDGNDDGGGDNDGGGGNGGGDNGGGGDGGDQGGDSGDGDGDGGNGDDGGGDGNGDGEGDGDGDQDDGDDGEGDGEGGGIGPGNCDVDGQEAPECTDDQDGVQCAIALNTWHINCRDRLWKADVEGTDEYLAGDSLLGDSDQNAIREQEIDLSDRLTDLDDSGGGFGGSASCPSDKEINLGRFGTITLPMSFLCEWAQRINPMVQALGWLSAALIIVSRMSES